MTSRTSDVVALSGLKDFQQRTVEYVFNRMYGDKPTTRFLVADEVGLGKTLVARGIIARALDFLQDRVDRIDIVYVCSNAAIAEQNINRLNVGETNGFARATRLTYLPREVRSLRDNKVNFISLTPGTAFDHQRSRGGQADERAIIYQMLYDLPLARGRRRAELRNGLLNLMQATMGKEAWRHKARSLDSSELDWGLCVAFRKAVRSDTQLYSDLKRGCMCFRRYRKNPPEDDKNLAYNLIARLRTTLARVCLHALEPDLVILDEFQRFKDLMDGETPAADLANALFKFPNVRVLLLSATPYKMLSLDQDMNEDDHYPDFLRTLRFLLLDDDKKIRQLQEIIAKWRNCLQSGLSEKESLSVRDAVQRALLEVMCRTERVPAASDRNAMLREVAKNVPLLPQDLHDARCADTVASRVQANEPIEYWKSVPYLLNFLRHYQFGRNLSSQMAVLLEVLKENPRSARWLTHDSMEEYARLAPGNPKLGALYKDTVDRGLWQLLWMPASMPYTVPIGAYSGKENLTKSLVFSRWRAVPDAIASLCSYEAERQMIGERSVPHSELYKRFTQLLRFATSSRDSRLTGMPVLAWLMPSPTLASSIDPLAIAAHHGGPLPLDDMVATAEEICKDLIHTLPDSGPGTRVDERWYWAAPLLLEQDTGLLNWCLAVDGWSAARPDSEDSAAFFEHLDLLVAVAQGDIALGPRPPDLARLLAELALGAPGTCALRALGRVSAGTPLATSALLSAAARISFGFRSLFNMPETIAMLRGGAEATYWRLTLRYAMEGNIQAILDEYVHVLVESLGLQDKPIEERATDVAQCMHSVLTLRTSQISIDSINRSEDSLTTSNFKTRARFALRFGDIRDDDKAVVRADTVRDAFNSPFRPFVLASTSVGQEGLDFHVWCHAVTHWNLPSNPVDLEQREGRVHRYKGHAVRKNVAHRYGLKALKGEFNGRDPWKSLFDIAAAQRDENLNDLVPYWIFDGPAHIERRIPLLPYSREVGKLTSLKDSLTLYRLAFGQPRQEDLLATLSRHSLHTDRDLTDWLISLTPPDDR